MSEQEHTDLSPLMANDQSAITLRAWFALGNRDGEVTGKGYQRQPVVMRAVSSRAMENEDALDFGSAVEDWGWIDRGRFMAEAEGDVPASINGGEMPTVYFTRARYIIGNPYKAFGDSVRIESGHLTVRMHDNAPWDRGA